MRPWLYICVVDLRRILKSQIWWFHDWGLWPGPGWAWRRPLACSSWLRLHCPLLLFCQKTLPCWPFPVFSWSCWCRLCLALTWLQLSWHQAVHCRRQNSCFLHCRRRPLSQLRPPVVQLLRPQLWPPPRGRCCRRPLWLASSAMSPRQKLWFSTHL